MGKQDRAKKNVRRLQLRSEVVRVLASDTLAQVVGGLGSPCLPISKTTITTTKDCW
ncbi:MAG TPA: hypothetical protein VFU21_21275 [Kofleriaceae bacterium]|nr:hypothetical protein [Kofleriaceae bacterium]